jgi:NADH-quinone oxidoreductase subunit M
MLIALFIYQQAGSFLLEDLYKLNLSATEQLDIPGSFFLAYAKIPLIPFHTWQMCTKSTCCRNNVAFRIMLKMDCTVLFVATTHCLICSKKSTCISSSSV